jgi:hypothetical protein
MRINSFNRLRLYMERVHEPRQDEETGAAATVFRVA